MAPIELLRGLGRLGAGAEEHGVDHTKSGMETADWLVQQVGMLGQRGRDPGVSQLQQRRAPRTEKDGRLAVYLPSDGTGAEETIGGSPGNRSSESSSDGCLRARRTAGMSVQTPSSLDVRQGSEREHRFSG